MNSRFGEIERALLANGLMILGHFVLADGEIILADEASQPKALAIVGNAGSSIWPCFAEARARQPGLALDRWTADVVGDLADQAGIRALFPFDGPPFWPFTTWAIRTGTLFRSPIGLTVHPVFGLWHAFRAALLFDDDPRFPATDEESPCDRCAERPCLGTCPVNAFSVAGYDFKACLGYLCARENPCRSEGCDARKACPVGQDHRYQPEHAAFHMNQLLKVHGQA
jgi:hypothetical protein